MGYRTARSGKVGTTTRASSGMSRTERGAENAASSGICLPAARRVSAGLAAAHPLSSAVQLDRRSRRSLGSTAASGVAQHAAADTRTVEARQSA
jgi:hypothetical protein